MYHHGVKRSRGVATHGNKNHMPRFNLGNRLWEPRPISGSAIGGTSQMGIRNDSNSDVVLREPMGMMGYRYSQDRKPQLTIPRKEKTNDEELM